jgi:hypothetical protein
MHQRYRCCRHWVATRQNGRRWQRLFLGYEKEGARNPTKVLLQNKRHKVTICRREKKVQTKTIAFRMFPLVFHKHWTLLYELYPNLASSSRPLPGDRQSTCLTDLDEPSPSRWAACPGARGPTGEICKSTKYMI